MNQSSKNRISIGALTDHTTTPSSRFRLRQLIAPLKFQGFDITDFPRKYSSQNLSDFLPDRRIRDSILKTGYAVLQEMANIAQTAGRIHAVTKYDYIYISREIIVGYPSFERLVGKDLIYDIDDAIFLFNSANAQKTRTLLEKAKFVIAGNEYLADWCRKYSKNVSVIPTAVDTNRFRPIELKNYDEFIVGWSGTSAAFKYLVEIEDQLKRFFETHEKAVFVVCSDRFPKELAKLVKYIRFKKWSEEIEVQEIQSFTVGIMPSAWEEWALGKCSYKMLLYLSCGVPCCVSSWGMNVEVLAKGELGLGIAKNGDWCEALSYMYKSRFELNKIFPDCRSVVKNHYALPIIVNKFTLTLNQKYD
jgi:glycosyltransferase involved in cell wall biosynthesis